MSQHFTRFFQAPGQQSFFLIGPRGTGKTTWLHRHYADAIWIDLLDPEQFRFYSAKPERLRGVIDAHPNQHSIVIDEVQKLPELLSLVHSLIEEKRGLQFLMTGSSARKLRQAGTNLLAGRALLKLMHPFFAAELGDAFTLEKGLEIGMLPLVWDADESQQVLNTYAGLYLKEEVQAEGIVRNVGSFSRFMEVMSFSHGCSLNAANIARECDITRKTVEHYLQILEDLLLSYTLRVFTRRAQRAVASHPKFYFFDTGVFRALRPSGPLDRPEEMQGLALEGIVGQHLRAWVDFQSESHTLSFWRTKSGLEVDFIVYGPKGFWAIEVKNKKRISGKDVKGLKAFQEDYPECTPLLVYRGKHTITENGILCLPCEDFLKSIVPTEPL